MCLLNSRNTSVNKKVIKLNSENTIFCTKGAKRRSTRRKFFADDFQNRIF